jgi:aminoglycoside phosphotransferase (APT) family kinase protein
MSPADIAATALRVDVRELTAIEPIKHGLTNDSWLVRFAHDAVVVRLSNAASDRLQIDRVSEALILDAAGAIGIGAPVLLCNPQQRTLVTRYLGANWSEDDARSTANIMRLGKTFRKLHSIQPPAGVHRVALLNVVEDYLLTLKQHGVKHDAPFAACARVLADLLDKSSACLCHNDVHRLNVVDDGSIRLIDWEYAGIGSPLFDLASVCVYHTYDADRRDELLAAYARPDVASPKLLTQACELFDYIRGLWMQVRELPPLDS